jgi:hypothetical protein
MSGLSRCDSLAVRALLVVLKHHSMDLKDRLCCGLVNKRLHAEARGALQQLVLGFKSPPTDFKQGRKLSTYGVNATTVTVSGPQWRLQHLPCQQLRKLDLLDCSVQLEGGVDYTEYMSLVR